MPNVDACVALFTDLETLPCGDGAGPAGEDVPCSVDVGIVAGVGSLTLIDVAANDNVGSGLVVGLAEGLAGVSVSFGGSQASVSQNGAADVVVHPGASLTITGNDAVAKLPVVDNAGVSTMPAPASLHAES